MVLYPPRLPRIPVDEQPIDPTAYIPDLPEDHTHHDIRALEDELLALEDYEDPTVIDDWLQPYRPKVC